MKIDLRDIREGETEFAFEETPADLHLTGEDAHIEGAIDTRLVVYKYGASLSAKGQTTCLARPECARCLEPIAFPIDVSYAFVFQKGRVMGDEDDEMLIWIDEEPGEIDLGNEIKDYILLELPMIPTCAASPSGPCERYDRDPHELLEHQRDFERRGMRAVNRLSQRDFNKVGNGEYRTQRSMHGLECGFLALDVNHPNIYLTNPNSKPVRGPYRVLLKPTQRGEVEFYKFSTDHYKDVEI